MAKFTKAEEEIMHAIWALGKATVGDVVNHIMASSADKPANSTISTMLRIMEEKGYLTHEVVGRIFLYAPAITKADYAKTSLSTLVSDYFGGSAQNLVSALVKTESLKESELNALALLLDQHAKSKK